MRSNLLIRKGFERSPWAWREGFLAVARAAEAAAQASAGAFRGPGMTRKSALQTRISPVRRMSLAGPGVDA